MERVLDAERDLTDGAAPPEPYSAADWFDSSEGQQQHSEGRHAERDPYGGVATGPPGYGPAPGQEADEFAPDRAAAGRPRPAPADVERLEQLLTEFSATPVFAWMLADWTGPAASILVGDAMHDISHAAYVVPVAAAAPRAAARPAAPLIPAPAEGHDHYDSPAFSAHVSGGFQSAVVAAFGDIRPDTVGLLTAAVWQALGEAPTQVVVDLREVTHFSTAGLRALVDLRDAAADVATDFRLRAPSNAVRRVIEARSGSPLFEVDEDEDASDRPAPWSPPDIDYGDAAQQPQHASAGRRY